MFRIRGAKLALGFHISSYELPLTAKNTSSYFVILWSIGLACEVTGSLIPCGYRPITRGQSTGKNRRHDRKSCSGSWILLNTCGEMIALKERKDRKISLRSATFCAQKDGSGFEQESVLQERNITFFLIPSNKTNL